MSAASPQVALDASAIPAELTGAGVYVQALARALSARGDLELSVISRRGDARRWEALGVAAVHAVAPNSRPARLAFAELALGRALRRTGTAELLHGPHYTMPRRAPVPVVVTIHDLTMIEHPEWHEPRKVRYFTHAIGYAVEHAARLICVSDQTAARLSARFSPACPVEVIPHGVDHGRFRPAPDPGDEVTLAGLGVSGRYLLFLGTLEPRKNVARLVEAFELLAGAEDDLGLVLAGKRGWRNEALDRALAGARYRTRIKLLGYVPEGAPPALLRRASVVCYPSSEEGFGLPALEALACGTPLVTTAGSVMAELAGAAAFTAVDDSAEGLAAALTQALASDGQRRAAGVERAAAFTWEASAAAHTACYRAALSGR